MKIDTENIFLIDGIGASMSAIALGVVLPYFQQWVNMPLPILFILCGLAIGFALFSFTIYILTSPSNSRWLRRIMLANLSYCTLTALLVYKYFNILTQLGLTYFIGEILIILTLVGLEYKIYRNNTA